MDRSVQNRKIGERNQFFPLHILNVTWSTQNWLKWWLEKVRVVYIDGCFDEYCGKVRAGLQSNFDGISNLNRAGSGHTHH